MHELAACYRSLSSDNYDRADLADRRRRFAGLYTALEATGDMWWARPQLHMPQELCELDSTMPANHCPHTEEDVGGSPRGLGALSWGGHRRARTAGM